jgi:hypothetical protein
MKRRTGIARRLYEVERLHSWFHFTDFSAAICEHLAPR